MKRKISLSLILAVTPALGGCVAQAALAAAELATYIPQTERPSNAHLKGDATQACTQRAAQYGTVYVMDVEQRRNDLLIVWGSIVDTAQRRRTFECQYTTGLSTFRLRDIGR